MITLIFWYDDWIIAEQKDDSLGPLSYYAVRLLLPFSEILIPDIDVPASSDLFDFTTSLFYHLVQVYIYGM